MDNLVLFTPHTDNIASPPYTDMLLLEYDNGAAHIIGGIHMSYHAAEPHFWWRNSASALAASIISTTGGASWDNQGVIHIVVPHIMAWEAHHAMMALFPDGSIKEKDDKRNLSSLIAYRCAAFALKDNRLVYEKRKPYPPQLSWFPAGRKQTRKDEAGRYLYEYTINGEEDVPIKAPWLAKGWIAANQIDS